jgi:hypothetical protein
MGTERIISDRVQIYSAERHLGRSAMKQYKPSTARTAVAFAALVMTLVTFGLVVVLPATTGSGTDDVRAQAAVVIRA